MFHGDVKTVEHSRGADADAAVNREQSPSSQQRVPPSVRSRRRMNRRGHGRWWIRTEPGRRTTVARRRVGAVPCRRMVSRSNQVQLADELARFKEGVRVLDELVGRQACGHRSNRRLLQRRRRLLRRPGAKARGRVKRSSPSWRRVGGWNCHRRRVCDASRSAWSRCGNAQSLRSVRCRAERRELACIQDVSRRTSSTSLDRRVAIIEQQVARRDHRGWSRPSTRSTQAWPADLESSESDRGASGSSEPKRLHVDAWTPSCRQLY